jgi:DNA-binding CsgD family transcriptional regulator
VGDADIADMKKNKTGYSIKLLSSLRNLLSARELLLLRNIRTDYLHYFFAFPVAMIFINVQDFVLDGGVDLFGLTHTTVTFLAFVAGAVVIFAVLNKENISAISKISALITIGGFVPWLFLPNSQASLLCSVVFMAGVGGCVSSSSFSYVFMLNNTERFFGSALMILLIESIELGDELIPVYPVARKIVALVMIAGLSTCMLLSKKRDYAGAGENAVGKFDPSVWLALYIFLAYFAIRITGFYAPAFQHPSGVQLWGTMALALTTCCVALQAIFKRSVWTLCNVFFLTSIMAYVMWYVKLPHGAYLFSELKEVGLLIALYLVGCVTNKFCDFRMHKRLILLCMAAVGVLYAGIDILHTMMPTQTIAVVTTAVLFVLFLLLSPSFSQFLFFADWSKEFRLIHMSAPAEAASPSKEAEHKTRPSLDDTNLSPREKQVVLLLLRGMTLRQVAPELGLTFSTVSTYSKAIYKKLGINSRAELFLLFGYAQAFETSGSGTE